MELDRKLKHGIYFGGIFLLIAAAMLFCWSLLSLLAGNPPSQAESISNWIETNRGFIAFSNESISFATFFLVFGSVGLSFRLWFFTKHPVLAIVSTSAIAISIFNLAMMNVFLGRLVYPVFGLLSGTDSIVLSLSSYYGALHMFDLVWAVIVIIVGISFYREESVLWFLLFSIIVGVSELVVAYPWVFSPGSVFALRIPFQVWLVVVGVGMIQYRKGLRREI